MGRVVRGTKLDTGTAARLHRLCKLVKVHNSSNLCCIQLAKFPTKPAAKGRPAAGALAQPRPRLIYTTTGPTSLSGRRWYMRLNPSFPKMWLPCVREVTDVVEAVPSAIEREKLRNLLRRTFPRSKRGA